MSKGAHALAIGAVLGNMRCVLSDFDDSSEREAAVPGETNRERFVRIGQRRTQQVLEKLRILGNCSNRSIYEYTEDDIDKIFRAIMREVDLTRARFEDRAARTKFKL